MNTVKHNRVNTVKHKRVNTVKHKRVYTEVTRDVIIQGNINLERLNFVLWGLTFVGGRQF